MKQMIKLTGVFLTGMFIGAVLTSEKGKEMTEKAKQKISDISFEDLKVAVQKGYKQSGELASPEKIEKLEKAADELIEKAKMKNVDLNKIIERLNKIADSAADKIAECQTELNQSGIKQRAQNETDAAIEEETEAVEEITDEL